MKKLQDKRKKAELTHCMMRMVDEANSLRSEAAEKMYGVPKGYKLITKRVESRNCVLFFVAFAFYLSAMGIIMWCLDHEYFFPIVLLAVILCFGMIWISSVKSRRYDVTEHTDEFFINEAHCEALAVELGRLRAGIADYDRQYAEQEEYILKFKEHCTEVEDYGSLTLVLKANDFHAHVKMSTDTDEVDCRLKFNEADYGRLIGFIEFFNKRT